MQSTLDTLRQARREVIPLVPELAPWLPRRRLTSELDIVQEELNDAIAAQDVDPGTISAPDFNKLSRTALAGGAIRLQREHLIEGREREARFTQEAIDDVNAKGKFHYFMGGLLGLQDLGARYVESTYSAGRDKEHSWYPLLRRRHQELGHMGLKVTPPGLPPARGFMLKRLSYPLPIEAESTRRAMNTAALGRGVSYMLEFVGRKIKDTSTRIEAAHDIAPQFLGGLASLHFYELNSPRPEARRIKGEIVKNDKTGRYRFLQTHEQVRKLYPHLPDDALPNARLKCTAHTAVKGDDTDMMYFVHAAINFAAEHYDVL